MLDPEIRRLIPNLLSTTRLVLVPCLFICPPEWRIVFLCLAVLTDFLDGQLARRWNVVSSFGTIIDPIGDKAIAIALAVIFWPQGIIRLPELIAFFSRDIALLLFGFYCLASAAGYQGGPFRSGKAASAIQAVIAAFWCCGRAAPTILFIAMALCGIAGLAELILSSRTRNTQKIC